MSLEQLNSIWKLRSIYGEGEDGTKVLDPLGENPSGFLTYDPEGWVNK